MSILQQGRSNVKQMKVLYIYRLPQGDHPTFGNLVREDGVPICNTLERPYKNNQHGISCFPPGEYAIKRTIYHKHGYETFEVICPPRERCLFHRGNLGDDTHGCVLPGEQFEPVLNPRTGIVEDGILASGPAFNQFMKYLEGESEAKLVVIQI